MTLMDLAALLITVMISAAILCFIVSEITRNYSQVDKLWSIMPVVYSIITLSMYPAPRIILMTILVTLWGMRLSYNFHRRGGYSLVPWRGEEDYRWGYVRKSPLLQGRVRFGLFNLFFISFYQHLLIFLISSPLVIAAAFPDSDLNWIDGIAAVLMLLFLLIETIADNQRFKFHKLKKSGLPEGGEYSQSIKQGFLSEGLWAHVRHPNFTSEQAIWISFYLFGIASSGKLVNWTLAGPVLLVLLFAGSTVLTERISREKYPLYEEYIRRVPKFLPGIFR